MDLDTTLNNFIAHTGKSKVAIIIPLFGYWKDIKDNPLNLETLQISMDRLTSSIHNLYIFFVAEPNRMPKEIQNYIVVKSKAEGNCVGIHMNEGSSYADYVRKGFEAAHDTTDSSYFVVLNPWNIIQRIGIDAMVDRLNFGDMAKLVCGYDIRTEIDIDQFNPKSFENHRYNIPVEKNRVDPNFMGITRYAFEMTPLDENIKTIKFLAIDMFQNLHSKGYTAIASQRIPMFVFDVNIEAIENTSDVEADKAYFVSKWGFIPNM